MAKNILLVVKDVESAKQLSQRLVTLKYHVAGHAQICKQALRMAAQLAPDLILIDIRSDAVVEQIDEASTIRSFGEIPVIFLADCLGNAILNRARMAGASEVLVKPVDDRQ